MKKRSIVAAEPVDTEVRAAVRNALAGAEWQRVFPRGAAVSLKANLG